MEKILPPPPPLKRSGASVLRIYKYYKDKSHPPSLPATGCHSDLGLITVALRSAVPGLMIFHETQGMMDVERVQSGEEEGPDELIVFAGEALGLITGGRIRAPVHYVDESFIGQPRFSFPFFLRPRPEADISQLIDPSVQNLGQHEGPFTFGMFIERIMWRDRAWSIAKPGSSNSPLANFGTDY